MSATLGRRKCRWLLGRLQARRHLFSRLYHRGAGRDLPHRGLDHRRALLARARRAAAAFTYYNIPLLETGRPTIGANQYGIFIQAFGLIRWRAIERIDLAEIAERAMTVHELQIVLDAPLGSALVADWRKQPTYRLLMRLPWRMSHNGSVRVNWSRSTSRRM